MSTDWQLALFLGVLVPIYAVLSVIAVGGVLYLIRREWHIWRGRRRLAARDRERDAS